MFIYVYTYTHKSGCTARNSLFNENREKDRGGGRSEQEGGRAEWAERERAASRQSAENARLRHRKRKPLMAFTASTVKWMKLDRRTSREEVRENEEKSVRRKERDYSEREGYKKIKKRGRVTRK